MERPGVPCSSQCASSNKTVLCRFLNISVSVMSRNSVGRLFQGEGPKTEIMVSKFSLCSWQYVVCCVRLPETVSKLRCESS